MLSAAFLLGALRVNAYTKARKYAVMETGLESNSHCKGKIQAIK